MDVSSLTLSCLNQLQGNTASLQTMVALGALKESMENQQQIQATLMQMLAEIDPNLGSQVDISA